MANPSFEDFIENQEKPSEEKEINWSKQKDEWIGYVNSFNDSVKEFLEPYFKTNKIVLIKEEISISEEFIGSYKVNSMLLKIGSNRIKFTPIGTNLIGAKGRIDMEGPNGIVKFVLVSKESTKPIIKVVVRNHGEIEAVEKSMNPIKNWTWKISTPPPRIIYTDFDSSNFQDALMEVVNG